MEAVELKKLYTTVITTDFARRIEFREFDTRYDSIWTLYEVNLYSNSASILLLQETYETITTITL